MAMSAIAMRKLNTPLEFCVYLDVGDKIDAVSISGKNVTMKLFSGPRLPTSTMTNLTYSQSNGEILLYAADDIEFKSFGWDEIVLQEMRDPLIKPKVLITNDLSPTAGEKGTHAFVSRAYCETVDYLLPPYFESEFCDTWITEVAREAGILSYRKDLVIEHLHYLWEKSDLDEIYEYRRLRYKHYELLFYYKIMLFLRRREVRSLRSK